MSAPPRSAGCCRRCAKRTGSTWTPYGSPRRRAPRQSLRSIAEGQPLALLFVAERCPVCKSLLPNYEEVLRRAGFAPFVVGDRASTTALAQLAASHGVASDRILAAPELAAALQVLQTPTLALLDREGGVLQKRASRDRVIYSAWRCLSRPLLGASIEWILSHKPLLVPSRPAALPGGHGERGAGGWGGFGCGAGHRRAVQCRRRLL